MNTNLAIIKQIFLYPVKGMRGVAVDEAFISLNGLLGDRRYAFARQAVTGSNGFPWATARNEPRMILYAPRFERPPLEADADPPVRVTTPAGDEFDVQDARLSELLTREYDEPVFLFKTARGNFDSQHVSLFSLVTARALAAEVGLPINPRQFRANFFIEPVTEIPFIEDEWIGRVVQVGDAVVGLTKKNTRCMVITLDIENANARPQILRTVTQAHNQQAGIYGNVVAPGIVRVGDVIRLA